MKTFSNLSYQWLGSLPFVLGAVFFATFFPVSGALAQCVPAAVNLCVAGDDGLSIWINGNLIASSVAGSTTGDTCFVVPPADVAVGTNDIAVSVYNTTPGYAYGSWDLQIVCSAGTTVDINSDSGNTQMYNYIPAGVYAGLTPPPANANTTPPTLGCGATAFYQPAYASCLGAGWTVPYEINNGTPAVGGGSGAYYFVPVEVAGVPVGLGADPCGESGNEPSGPCDNTHNPIYQAPYGQILYFVQTFVWSCCTPTVTFTNTFTPTSTNTPTSTPTNTATITDTNTPTNTVTNTVMNTATNTATNTSTNTGVNTPANTATGTDTPTATNTPTVTSTNTVTNTATATATNTAMNTPTHTATVTDTNTATNTSTNTGVNTPTNTATVTDTNTLTNTATTTATDTVTNTPVNTFTYTNTPTTTDTATSTNTATITDTNTPTHTATVTSTKTASSTLTSTATVTATNSITNTATITVTSTPTGTPTMTATSTSTSTPVAGVTMAKNASETTAQAGTTFTYAIGITVTGNSVNNMVVTDVLPSGLTFVSFGTMPAGTVTVSNPPNLKWTLPSPLVPGIYQLTYQVQVNSSAAGGTLTNNAQLTYTGLGTPITSSVNVQVPGVYTVNIDIYNSAGEVVKVIPVQSFSQPINNITLSTSNLITTLQGPGSIINIYYDGILIGTWNGSNNSGNPVTNGNYAIKVDSVSPQGVVTSVEQDATVNRALSDITANIYNSAGEVVRTLYFMVGDATDSQMTNVNLSSNIMTLGLNTSGGTSILQIIVNTTGTPVTLTWDGTNNSATNVTPGTYSIQLHWNNGQGQTTNITRSVIVVGAGANGTVIAEPNVLTPGQTLTTLNGTGIANAWILNAKIYTIAGELVKSIPGSPGTATAQWDALGIASGVYIVAVQVQDSNGGVLENQLLKVLVLH